MSERIVGSPPGDKAESSVSEAADVSNLHCTHCGAADLAPGFIEDAGESSRGYARWIEGPLQLGVFGDAKRRGRARWPVDAYRCRRCSHLELFARPH